MLYQPSSIIQSLSSQLSYISIVYQQMFYCMDTGILYYDTQDNKRTVATDIYVLQYEYQRNNYIPDNRKTFATESQYLSSNQLLLNYVYVYVVETNSLYSYDYTTKVWTTIYGTYGTTTVATTYLPNGQSVVINADDVTTNGILNDGSVVVRDANRMICGLAKSDGYTFTIKSLIGGQINLEPSGNDSGEGCVQVNASDNPTLINNDVIVFGNIKTANKTDWNKQYRLVTQDITITSNTVIKSGSTIVQNSVINTTKYNKDTIITEDLNVTSGLIITGSKLYKNTIINGIEIKPPFLLDITNISSQTNVNSNNTTNVTKTGNKLIVNINSPFITIGDFCYITTTGIDLAGATTVKFLDSEYSVDYVTTSGTANSAKILYTFGSKVKILP